MDRDSVFIESNAPTTLATSKSATIRAVSGFTPCAVLLPQRVLKALQET